MRTSGTRGFQSDQRGNLLTIGAVALAVLLVVSSLAIATGGVPGQTVAPDAGSNVEMVETGVAAELENSTLSSTRANATAANATNVSVSVSDGPPNRTASGDVPPVARAAVRNTFDGTVSRETQRQVTALLTTIARQQQASGEMTTIEPSAVGVDYGVTVVLGGPRNATTERTKGATHTRSVVVRTVDETTRTRTTTAPSRPGPEWRRVERVGTTNVTVDAVVQTTDPGDEWVRVRVLDSREPVVSRTTNATRPGPDWTRLGPNGTAERLVEETVSTTRPGPQWDRLGVVGHRDPQLQRVRNVSRPGPNWTRVAPAGTTTVLGGTTVATASPGPDWQRVEVLNRSRPEFLVERAASAPGPDWTRLNRSGTVSVVRNETIATTAPGPAWERVTVVDSIEPIYDTIRNRTAPGPAWERHRQVRTTTVVDTRVAQTAPGPEWTRADDETGYEYRTSTERPGPAWHRSDRVGTETVVSGYDHRWAQTAPGPDWENTSESRYATVRNTTWARTAPGPTWTRTGETRRGSRRTEVVAHSRPGPDWKPANVTTTWARDDPGRSWVFTGETRKSAATRTKTTDTRSPPGDEHDWRLAGTENTTRARWGHTRPDDSWRRTGESRTVTTATTRAFRSPDTGSRGTWIREGQVGLEGVFPVFEWRHDVTEFEWQRVETEYRWERNVTVSLRQYGKATEDESTTWYTRRNATEHRWVNATTNHTGPTEFRFRRANTTTVPVYEWRRSVASDEANVTYRRTREVPVYEYRTVVRPAQNQSLYRLTEQRPAYRFRKPVANGSTVARYVRTEKRQTYTWKRQLQPARTLYRYGIRENVTTYDWRRLEREGYELASYERVETKPLYRWEKNVTNTVTQYEEVELAAYALASDDARQPLLLGANGTRDSTVTIVTETLPIGADNATRLRAVPNGTGSARLDDEAAWTVSAYRNASGAAVFDIDGTTVTNTGATTRIDLDDPSVNGTTVDAPSMDAAMPGRFDLYLDNGTGVYGSYSLFATNPAASGMRRVENVTVERAIDSATFDVTYNDARTTYTDTVTVTPNHDPLDTVTIERPTDGETPNAPPEAAVDITPVSTTPSTVTYEIDASGSTADSPLAGYQWVALDHEGRLSGLKDGQLSQRITAERVGSDYYLPIALTVTDENGLEDRTEAGVTVPGTTATEMNVTASVAVVGVNDTHARVTARSPTHSDTGRYDFDYEIQSGIRNVRDRTTIDDGAAVNYTVRRATTDTTIAVELTLTDSVTGKNASAIDDAAIPHRPGAGLNPFRVTAEEVSRNASSISYRLEVSGADAPIIDWTEQGRINELHGLRDGLPTQTVTATRKRVTDTITVKATEQYVDDPASDRVNLTVPAIENNPWTQDLTADFTRRQLRGNTTHEVWGLDGTASQPAGMITNYDWSVTGPGTVVTNRNGRLRLAIERPDSGTKTAPVTLKVRDTRRRTDSTTKSVTVDASGGPPNGPITNRKPDAALSVSINESTSASVTYDLSASESEDLDGQIESYDFAIPDAGAADWSGSGPTRTVTVEKPIPEEATVTVTDDDGASDQASVQLPTTGDAGIPPRPEIKVGGGAVVSRSENIFRYQIDASDTSDPDGHVTSVEYSVLVENGELLSTLDDTRDNQSIRVRVVDANPDLKLKLTATDNDGLQNSTTAEVEGKPLQIDQPKIEALTVNPALPTVGEESDITVETSVPGTVSVYIDGQQELLLHPENNGSTHIDTGTHTFDSGGPHNVTAVLNYQGQTDTLTKTIDVNAPPSIDKAQLQTSLQSHWDASWAYEYDMVKEKTEHLAFWTAEIDTTISDNEGDDYTVTTTAPSRESPGSPRYLLQQGATRDEISNPSGLTGTNELDVQVPLRDEDYTTPGFHQITVTVTDEHGASTTRTFQVEEIETHDADVHLYPQGGAPDDKDTVYINDSETVPITFGAEARNPGAWSGKESSITVYGPDRNIIHESASFDYRRDRNTLDQLPDLVRDEDKAVSQLGQYTVKANYRNGYTNGVFRYKGGAKLQFTVKDIDAKPEVPNQWSTTDPGDNWEDVNSRQTTGVVGGQWAPFENIAKASQTANPNDYSEMIYDSEPFSLTSKQRTETKFSSTEPEGIGWEKTGKEIIQEVETVNNSFTKPPMPSDCGDCSWSNPDPGTWVLRETISEWERTEYYWQETGTVTEHLWMKFGS